MSHFIESINGASTIRAFGQTKQFIGDSQTKIGASVGNRYYNFAASRWFSIRIENVANLVIFFAALFAILNRQTLSPGMNSDFIYTMLIFKPPKSFGDF